jgi:hypothetical protein
LTAADQCDGAGRQGGTKELTSGNLRCQRHPDRLPSCLTQEASGPGPCASMGAGPSRGQRMRAILGWCRPYAHLGARVNRERGHLDTRKREPGHKGSVPGRDGGQGFGGERPRRGAEGRGPGDGARRQYAGAGRAPAAASRRRWDPGRCRRAPLPRGRSGLRWTSRRPTDEAPPRGRRMLAMAEGAAANLEGGARCTRTLASGTPRRRTFSAGASGGSQWRRAAFPRPRSKRRYCGTAEARPQDRGRGRVGRAAHAPWSAIAVTSPVRASKRM